MREQLGWDLATGALFVVIVFLAFALPEAFVGSRWMLIGIAAGILAVYAFGARRYVSINDDREPTRLVSATLQVSLVALLAMGIAIEPNMLLLQTLVLPLIWMTSRTTRQAVIVTLVNAVILGVSYAIWGGFVAETTIAGFLTTGLSAAFSLALGLWITRIAAWGSERQRLLRELTAAQAGLDAASREAGAAAERTRLAREVHDTIAQSLTSIVMLAERSRRDGSTDALALIEDAAREALTEARALVVVESSVGNASGSLAESLGRLGARFTRETGMIVEVNASEASVPRDLQVVLLRCAQEGLANVRKHAAAGRVTVTLTTLDDAILEIRDDGRGLGGVMIDDERGFGLLGMRDRVDLVGGSLSVADADGGGTALTVRIPLGRAVSEADS
ncbi:MAG: sensor histidine kinase [Actinomycetota bacterium]